VAEGTIDKMAVPAHPARGQPQEYPDIFASLHAPGITHKLLSRHDVAKNDFPIETGIAESSSLFMRRSRGDRRIGGDLWFLERGVH
jgi:hypothetical protein